MGLSKLDRLNRSTATNPSPHSYPHVRDYAPQYDTSLPMEIRKQHALESGRWMDPSELLHFGVTREEQAAAWIAHPLRKASAADFTVPPLDREPPGGYDVYRRFALHCHANGWSVFPEERGTGPHGRRPAIAAPRYKWNTRSGRNYLRQTISTITYGTTDEELEKLRVFAVLPSGRRDARISDAELAQEIENVSSRENMGIVIGAASGDIRVVDSDIADESLAAVVDELAEKHLGKTGFIRVGRWPKRQYIYRADTSDEKLMAFPSTSWAVMGPDGKPDLDDDGKVRNAIEFLGAGRNVTAYGLHHKTGQSFQWIGDLHPAIAGPEQAPVITSKQLIAFIEDIHENVRKLQKRGGSTSNPFGNGNGEAFSFEAAPSDARVWIPKKLEGQWTADANGVVSDGREDYLRYLSYAFAAANAHLLTNDADAAAVLHQFILYAQRTCLNGKMQDKPVEGQCRTKWRTVVRKWRASIKTFEKTGRYADKFVPFRIDPVTGRRPCSLHVTVSERPKDGSLDWLPEIASVIPELGSRSKINGVIKLEKSREQIAMDRKCRQLIESVTDREAIHARVAAEIDAAYDEMLAEVLEREQTPPNPDEPAPVLPLHILGGPTGSGKTTRGIRRIGAWCKQNPRCVGAADYGAMVIAMPTGDNIEEALKTAERNGMIVPKPELTMEEAAGELKALGVKVAIIRGKEYNKCQRLEEVKLLAKRGMNSARLCGAPVPKGTELEQKLTRKEGKKVKHEQKLCEFRERGECGYWNQMDDAANADIILVPHAYLTTLGVPEPIKNPRGVFIDESIVYRVLHQIRMPISALDVPRAAPWLTKQQKEDGVDAEDVRHFFEVAREIAKQALLAGRCPAADLASDPRGMEYVEAALMTCDRNQRDAKDVNPTLTTADIVELTKRENGTNLHEEIRFWRTVKERVQDLILDQHEPLPKPRAKGKQDMRLQVATVTVDGMPEPFVRISWRSEPNWSGAPMMLLDASASPKIMAKVFSREIVRHDISAPLHVRTVAMVDSAFSNSSFIPREGATDDQIKICRYNVTRARALITKIAVSYSYGMVLVGMAMPVREVIFAADWQAPPNVEVGHFGAFRGLDFAKDYVAALSIGRSEQPVHIIDGYAAALSYDDDEPELPHDKLGTGFNDGGQPVLRIKRERLMTMRTGEDYGLEVPEMPSAWGKELEEQWREEEQRQFVGRLRPVYRLGDAPTWICMTKCMPSGFVIDDVVALDDTLQDSAVWSVLKRCQGVLAPGLTDKLDWVQKLLGDLSIDDWLKEKLSADKAFISRMGQTLYDVRYRIDGVYKQGRIAGWHEKPEEVFHALCEAVGVTATDVEISPLVKERVVGARRKPDRLANELAAAREARREAKAEAEEKGYVALVHALLPAEEGITVEELYERHKAGERIEDRLVAWLHSWHPERDTISREEVAAEWEEIKATRTTAQLYELFSIAGCVAAE